jgi:hypothetical protein
MASAPDSLPDRLADEVLATSARRKSNLWFESKWAMSMRCAECLESILRLILGFGGRVAGTLGASNMLTIDTHLVGPKGSFASMTGAANSHANRLGHALDSHVAPRFPLSKLKRQPILGEKGASLLFLDGVPVRYHGRLRSWFGGGLLRWGGGRPGTAT